MKALVLAPILNVPFQMHINDDFICSIFTNLVLVSVSCLCHTGLEDQIRAFTSHQFMVSNLVLDANGRCYVQNRKLTKFVELESHVPALF